MILIGRADHPAHVDVRLAGSPIAALPLAARIGDAGRILHVAVKAGNVEFLKLLATQHLDADRHVLQVLRALLRGDDDLFERIGFGLRGGMRRGRSGKNRRNGRGERQQA